MSWSIHFDDFLTTTPFNTESWSNCKAITWFESEGSGLCLSIPARYAKGWMNG